MYYVQCIGTHNILYIYEPNVSSKIMNATANGIV